MSNVVVICNRGIGEAVRGATMLSHVTDLLPRSWTIQENTAWIAQYGPAGLNAVKLPFLDAVADGAEALVLQVATAVAAGNRVVLLGYSGGAVVVHRALEMITAPVIRSRIAAVGFIADPEQPRGLPRSSGRFGIRGGTPIPLVVPARWAYDPDDGICLCPDPSPLRAAAQWSADIGLGSPMAWEDQARRFIRLRRYPAYAANVLDLRGEVYRWTEAARLVEGYLVGRDHTSYPSRHPAGSSNTYTEDLAAWILSVDGIR